MEFQQILAEIKNKKFHPVYFLHGKEPYFIDAIAKQIEEHTLSESERAFNQSVFYGKDVDHMAIVDTARRFPMMAPRQLVLLKEAQDMRSLDSLLPYIEKPAESTVLVIAYKYKKLNMNTKLGKALKKTALVFESKPLYDNQVPGWIANFLKGQGLKVTPKAAELIAENLGADLSKVANELDKLALNLPANATVDDAAVERYVGISKDFNVFELQKAIGLRDFLKAQRIVAYFTANPKKGPLPMLVGSLYNYFSKIYLYHAVKDQGEPAILQALGLRSSFFLKEYRAAAKNYPRAKAEQAIALLQEFDLKSKGVGYNSTGKPEGELMKEMVWRLMH
ncbi:DNA polymerase III subunit delta [Phaeodactylibacter luteus]|uniref:DNA polymerase III subunit delta n=1 Tax=Phaeodactylibacter luteus TaxID=1564516 RepID=A0A5C6RHG8_9BACT|nr:DNA polymerase III subunit delta [Phaeodactylibacter luteus]TXB61836.1 DNA polymerase III subunit delta [Phaeodactylibacter luteus]